MRVALVLLVVCGACRLNFDAVASDSSRDSPGDAPAIRPSCANLPATCQPATGSLSCCDSILVPGGAFLRSYDAAADVMYPDMSNPATIQPFMLDTFEVTVGRFRAFVDAGMGTQATAPATNAGENPRVPGSGWSATYNAQLPADTATLTAAAMCSNFPTWSPTPGTNDLLPMNCVSWYVANAFCAWDGGYLPTEAEWNFAAAGGDEQRAYPWSNPPSDATTYDCTLTDYQNAGCGSGPSPVDTHTGTGRWGHKDLGGNVWEWVFDANVPYTNPCDECASLTGSASRIVRGGSFTSTIDNLRVANRFPYPAANHLDNVGWRCAHAP